MQKLTFRMPYQREQLLSTFGQGSFKIESFASLLIRDDADLVNVAARRLFPGATIRHGALALSYTGLNEGCKLDEQEFGYVFGSC